ncbi:MAG: pyrroline-5-carboxylate reductase [Lachnospiraceae bacterium]|nr:pyrroline-5-carboxylate reductase [Lachnospiraceae bacterium]
MSRKYKVGFIGCGNMGSAMLKGLIASGRVAAKEMVASEKYEPSRQAVAALGVDVTDDNAAVTRDSDVLFVVVKPYQLDDVLPDIRDNFSADQILIYVAAGRSISSVEQACMSIEVAGKIKVVRCMPNTPALVGEGMTAISVNANMTTEDTDRVLEYMEAFGRAKLVGEDMMDCVTGLSGSSPAFVYMMIEAMADAAVAEGMTRPQAYEFAAQTVRGAATMVLETGQHPGALKDAVCSPGGTTIEGVLTLEDTGFRSSVVSAVTAAVERSREMS